MMDTPKTDSQTEELKAITRQLELLTAAVQEHNERFWFIKIHFRLIFEIFAFPISAANFWYLLQHNEVMYSTTRRQPTTFYDRHIRNT